MRYLNCISFLEIRWTISKPTNWDAFIHKDNSRGAYMSHFLSVQQKYITITIIKNNWVTRQHCFYLLYRNIYRATAHAKTVVLFINTHFVFYRNLKISARVFPGGTDSSYLREIGIPCLGFSPINNTPILLHDHDEFLNTSVFLRGIEIYSKIIEKLCY